MSFKGSDQVVRSVIKEPILLTSVSINNINNSELDFIFNQDSIKKAEVKNRHDLKTSGLISTYKAKIESEEANIAKWRNKQKNTGQSFSSRIMSAKEKDKQLKAEEETKKFTRNRVNFDLEVDKFKCQLKKEIQNTQVNLLN